MTDTVFSGENSEIDLSGLDIQLDSHFNAMHDAERPPAEIQKRMPILMAAFDGSQPAVKLGNNADLHATAEAHTQG